jgi:hypothetical protein
VENRISGFSAIIELALPTVNQHSVSDKRPDGVLD